MLRRSVIAVALLAVGCGESRPPAPARTATATATAAAETTATAPPRPARTPVPRLRGTKACPDVPGATCSTLRVPLDRSGGERGTLNLRVAVSGDRRDPVLVVLSGGPGEPGLPFLLRARDWLGPVTEDVRLVAIDQRGTGEYALECPALQDAMGASDLTPAPAAAVRGCADTIGDKRRFFTTADTVEDLEALRIALKAGEMAFDGVSYGTYVAQRYALAYPKRVSRLVLDSVVPAEGVSVLSIVPIKAASRVLGEQTTRDLAKVVKERRNGPEMLDMLTGLSVGAPRGNGAGNALRAAAQGNTGPLDGLHRGVLNVMGEWTAERLSQGLHASTLCADTLAPWGGAAAPLKGRKEALQDAAAELSAKDLHPFDRETATGNGIAVQCLNWPPVDVAAPPPPQDLPDIPILMLAGDLDLSTPLEWAQQAKRRAPGARLLIVEDHGHGIQGQKDPETLDEVRRFVASLR